MNPPAHSLPVTPRATAVACAWRMQRNCCLSPARLLAATCAVPAFSVALSLVFVTAGYPLIALFAVLQALGVVAAVLAYGRHAVDREDVAVHDGRLVLTVREGQRCRSQECCVHDVRLLCLEGDALVGCEAAGQRHRLGRHLRPMDRAAFAAQLAEALQRERAARPATGATRHAA